MSRLAGRHVQRNAPQWNKNSELGRFDEFCLLKQSQVMKSSRNCHNNPCQKITCMTRFSIPVIILLVCRRKLARRVVGHGAKLHQPDVHAVALDEFLVFTRDQQKRRSRRRKLIYCSHVNLIFVL